MARCADASVRAAAEPKVPVHLQYPHLRIMMPNKLGAAVRAGIVDDDDFVRGPAGLDNTWEILFQQVFPIPVWDHNAGLAGRERRRRSAQRFLRSWRCFVSDRFFQSSPQVYP